MNILIAPDKFKGSLSAREVCSSIGSGLRMNHPTATVRHHPLADGGDGTLAILREHLELKTVRTDTEDPLGRPLTGEYLMGGGKAFIEVATAAGIVLLNAEERDPLRTSTLGTGRMVADALSRDADTIYLLLGGSATNDLGTGIAHALGFRFLNEEGGELPPEGASLSEIREIVSPVHKPWADKEIILLCDVTNPLVGPRGAARVYAAQKGAGTATIERLEAGASSLGKLYNAFSSTDILTKPGGGAAGGIAAGLHALLGASLRSGFQTISELTGLEAAVEWADYVVTGEGQLDEQSLEGKVVGGVLAMCRIAGKPCYIFTGRNQLPKQITTDESPGGVYEIMSLAPDVVSAMGQAGSYLTRLGGELRLLSV